MQIDISKLPSKVLFAVVRTRMRHGRDPDRLEYNKRLGWFISPIHQHLQREGRSTAPNDLIESSVQFMLDFCAMSDLEVEKILVSRSSLDTVRYSLSMKGSRLHPEAERIFLERCKGKKSRMNALLTYCGKWEIMPENMTEITMVAGFEGGRRGRIGTDFMKKLAENKRRCKELLEQIMKLDGISEDEPISKIMERLS